MKLKGLAAALALSGATLFSGSAKASERPAEGNNLVRTTIEQDGKLSVDFSNTFLGATLAPTTGLDIVTDKDVYDMFPQNDRGVVDNLLEDGFSVVNKTKTSQLSDSEFADSFSSNINMARILFHEPTGTAFLGFSSHSNEQQVKEGNPNLASTSTYFQLRVQTDEQLRQAQDWLLASMNTAGHGAASEALWQLLTETTRSPLLKNLIKENGHSVSYHFTPQQLSQMKGQFDKTGKISVPQNLDFARIQTTR